MEKADEKSDKVKDVRTSVKNRILEKKQQTTSETSNLESASSSHYNLSENAESKVNMKTSHLNKLNDSSGLECRDGPNMSGDTDNDTRLRKVEGTFPNSIIHHFLLPKSKNKFPRDKRHIVLEMCNHYISK